MTKRSAFTLVELLVVICILAVLAALALPGIRTALARTNSAKCQSNLRQIGIAMNGYLNEHEQIYPSAMGKNGETTPWMWRLQPYTSMPANAMGFAPLPRAAGIFLCPEFHPPGREVAYGLNASMDPSYSFPTWNFRALNVPGPSTFLVVEMAVNTELFSPVSNGDVSRRHPQKSANFLFVDGHVENITEDVPRTDTRWFRQ